MSKKRSISYASPTQITRSTADKRRRKRPSELKQSSLLLLTPVKLLPVRIQFGNIKEVFKQDRILSHAASKVPREHRKQFEEARLGCKVGESLPFGVECAVYPKFK